MISDYSNKNLQNASFENQDLANVSFRGSDLRGADFSGADLTGADFTNVKTGIAPMNKIIVFFVSLVVSLVSGYVAMLTGTTVQEMVNSDDEKVKAAGILSFVMIFVFIAYYYWKGGRIAIRYLLFPTVLAAIVIGSIGYFSGIGTGRGMFFLVLSLLLMVTMVTIGTAARALAGALSSTLLFIIVAAGGSLFGKSLGGGIGTVIAAIACALISKRALSGVKGFESLRRITSFITSKFGTSFRNAKLANANFSHTKIHNADFTNAEVSSVNWADSKKMNCTPLSHQ